jgi:DNA invertase Pin-like site-specific DNA recombinase
MASTSSARRAIGIVRVSQVSGREGESFASPGEQADRIRAACERDGLALVDVIEELDVSGGTPLAQRAGLRRAVEAVEAHEADVIVAAYFDRLMRSLDVQSELVRRVEDAGGQVLAVDVGQVTNGSAGQWMSATALGMVAEYVRRTAKERSGEAQARAVQRGVVPWPNIGPGYVRDEDGRLVVDPATAPAVADAFAARAAGATIAEVRAMLSERGIKLSQHGTQHLLRSPLVLGEIVFGDLHNPAAHDSIVDREVWAAVQRVKVPRGRRAKSERLLARLGVLRCANCGSRMVVGTQRANGRSYPFYRCGSVREDCAHRVTISAEMVERVVIEAVQDVLGDDEGRASAADKARQAAADLATAQAALSDAISTFGTAGVMREASAGERLAQLRAARDDAQARADRLGGMSADLTVSVADWDRLLLTERRSLIAAVVESVTVAPGRRDDRVTVHLRGE